MLESKNYLCGVESSPSGDIISSGHIPFSTWRAVKNGGEPALSRDSGLLSN